MNSIKIKKTLEHFLLEDIGDRDLSATIFSPSQQSNALIRVKEAGVISGLSLLSFGYGLLDPRIKVVLGKQDGDLVEAGDLIAEISGPTSVLLSGERVLLNLLQRMSGIATLTSQCVTALEGSSTKITDTRKTTPGLRIFEKYAVRCGGGYNHRNGLYDAVMLKDNHIAASGSILEAVKAVREHVGHMTAIEVEVETKEQLLEAIEAKPHVIMLDNQIPETISEWVQLVPDFIHTEASGGITIDELYAYGQTGVDYISLGMLTHSVKSLDISLNLSISQKEVEV
ncbi:carboxylating nicotinate-nucleotide diphosphorylase [Lederbergia lenta]|uniref:Probable nicotinate-nucleotide pyrophosphorylase [carboxylating] n=1 Tax=Lederbergia lenta TaxID=1467 RepID=A0A2X4Z2T1_LEDLE|nr:carboxylating nicotinate-nucleotide diphosphorylase [Lederbergia lenta]MEC2324713.1 carboxylating nicotinate-nucleotide diphosphorylase [Lederbergia lenta]SQI58495.1 nicotinate-nucleotide diphosphorylase (carboxylating) [Lederbergia lenta]